MVMLTSVPSIVNNFIKNGDVNESVPSIVNNFIKNGDVNESVPSIVNNFIKNGDVNESVLRWGCPEVPEVGESKTNIWVQVTIPLIYYRFIVRFTIGNEFLIITFLLQFFLVQMSSLSISSSAIYSSTFYNHVYLSIYIILVYLKVGMNEKSVLSPLLFAVVMALSPVRREVVYLPNGCMRTT